MPSNPTRIVFVYDLTSLMGMGRGSYSVSQYIVIIEVTYIIEGIITYTIY